MSSERVVLIAVDASVHSKKAFEWYIDNVHRPDDMVVIAHCPEPPTLNAFSFKRGLTLPTDEWKKSIDEVREKTEKLRDEYEHVLRSKNLKKFKTVGESYRNVGEMILKIADEDHEKANLIVMGTRGLDKVKRAFMGSVSDYVLRNSRVPVLVCPDPEK